MGKSKRNLGALLAHGDERTRHGVRAQLREAAGDALTHALDRIEAHVISRSSGRAARRDPGERVREVLERDRALATATRAEETPPPAPFPVAGRQVHATASSPAACATAGPVVCEEPIRTRSMAKLLASQGHSERALAIYAYLMAQHPQDESLQAEAAALRAAQAETAACAEARVS